MATGIDPNDLKTGAHAEVLLSEQFLLNLTTTFWDAKLVPESFDLPIDLRLKVSEPLDIRISNSQWGEDVQVDFKMELSYQGGSPIPLPAVNFLSTLHLQIRPTNELDSRGFVNKIKLQYKVVNLTGTVHNLIVAHTGNDTIIPIIIANFNRCFGPPRPLDLFGPGELIHSTAHKYFTNTPQKALGLYVIFLLKKGPEPGNFIDGSIDLTQAVNFQPIAQDLTFGVHPKIFSDLGKDLHARMAKEGIPGSGYYTYPIKIAPRVHADILSIKVTPYLKFDGFSGVEFGKGLTITLKGKGSSVGFEADFKISMDFWVEFTSGKPELKMHIHDPDIEVDDFTRFVASFVTGWLFTFLGAFFLSPIGILSMGITGLLVGALGVDPIIEAIAASYIDDANKDLSSSFEDLLDNKFTLVKRRLHPFYESHFQLLADIDCFEITNEGIISSGRVYKNIAYVPTNQLVAKQAIFTDIEIPDALYFDVLDADKIETIDYYPDKLNTSKPSIFKLSIEDIMEMKKENQFTSDLLFQMPYKIRTKNNAIREILTISAYDHYGIINRHLAPYMEEQNNLFNNSVKDIFLQDIDIELADFLTPGSGREMLPQYFKDILIEKERQRRFIEKKEEWFKERELYFKRNLLPPLYEPDARSKRTLHMSPHAFGTLQLKGITAFYSKNKLMQSYQTGKYFYRSKRNVNTADNLSSLPKFKLPLAYDIFE